MSTLQRVKLGKSLAIEFLEQSQSCYQLELFRYWELADERQQKINFMDTTNVRDAQYSVLGCLINRNRPYWYRCFYSYLMISLNFRLT